jgi:hypothetical protein
VADPIRELPPPATEQDWAALHSFGGEFGGPAKRCLFDLRDRLAAVEARLPWVGTAADVAPQVVPATTAASLSPVEPAPQAPQGVTVHALVRVLSHATADAAGAAYVLWDHPRIGPLLRGEGAAAPKRVALAEDPPEADTPRCWRRIDGPYKTAWQEGYAAGWAAARTEVERRQGGQADG